MNNKTTNFPFEFSPKLIRFLGEELIHDKKIAIAELIKNAYDADADEVSLTIGEDEIIIEDNGCGMNADVIRHSWLKVGDSIKAKENKRSPKYHRLPIGEKGVGRLGVHRLGEKIQVISKQCDDQEVNFQIDWKLFENTTHLRELEPITLISHDNPQYFVNGKIGTKLIVTELKEKITKKDLQSINADLIKLLPPFTHPIQDNFRVTLITKDELFEDPKVLGTEHIIEHALFHYKIILDKNKIQQFDYTFISPDKQKIPIRKLSLDSAELQDLLYNLEKNHPQWNAGIAIGKICFEGYIFDQKFAKKFQSPYEKDIINYLKTNGGVRVYRDGMRIYNYGEEGKDNDILDLDRKRAKRIGDNIGYNQLLSSIELDREGSKQLIEKTNREGFIHNEAFLSLHSQLDFCMELVLGCRKIDRANMEPLFGKEYDKADINTKIKEIVSQVNQLAISEKEKQNLQSKLYEFSKEFEHLKNVFITASNTGLNLTFIIHDLDKIIDHLEQKIKDKNLSQIENVFSYLKNSIRAYKAVIRLNKTMDTCPMDELITQALFNLKYRFKYHDISFSQHIETELQIIAKKGLILGVLMNLFDNAIYWLEYYDIKHKKMSLNAYADDEFVYLVIADNGKGFNIGFEAALGPFISGRADDSSMGIGLHLAEQVMIAHEGSITHGNWQEEGLPEDFANGAIIKLKFPKGEKHVI